MEPQQIIVPKEIGSDEKNRSMLIFRQLVNETIYDVLGTLNNFCRVTIYDCLEQKYGLKKSELADHPPEFSEALRQLFGTGAILLEIKMMERLHRKIPQFKYRPKGALTFPEYIDALGRFICK